MPTATAVADALRPFDPTMDAQRLAETASSSPQPLDLITLRQSDRDAVAAGDRQPARRRHHAARRTAADRRPLRARHHQPGEEVGRRQARRPGGLAGGQRQPERRRRRRARRNAGCASPFGHHQPGSQRAGRRAGRGQHGRQEGDDRGDQAVDRRDPGRRAERRRRRRRPVGHHGSLPAGLDVQDHHRGRGDRPRHGNAQHASRLPRPHRHRPADDPQLRRLRPRHGADVAGVRELVQHDLRRAGEQDAAAGSDDRRRAVRHRDGLRRRRHHDGDRIGAADGQPHRAHRGRFRSGQGARQPVRHGAGRRDGRGGQDARAAADRGQAHRGGRG